MLVREALDAFPRHTFPAKLQHNPFRKARPCAATEMTLREARSYGRECQGGGVRFTRSLSTSCWATLSEEEHERFCSRRAFYISAYATWRHPRTILIPETSCASVEPSKSGTRRCQKRTGRGRAAEKGGWAAEEPVVSGWGGGTRASQAPRDDSASYLCHTEPFCQGLLLGNP